MTPCMKWLLRARPADYMVALSVAGASLPIVGKRLEPLGTITAMSVWGARHAPEFAAAAARGWLTPGVNEDRRRDRESTHEVSVTALRGVVSSADLEAAWPTAERTPPIWEALRQRRHLYRRAVHYGDSPAQMLDVWRRKDLPTEPAPVLIFVPGGAWVHGSRTLQGSALISRLAEQGWVCLAIDYRVSPHHRWPRHIADVKTAIAWARANVDKFGGDRNFVAVAGCSAGGHLSALAGLTGNDPAFQAALPEGADSSVDAVVGYLRPLRLGRPLHSGARPVRRLPGAGGGEAVDRPSPGSVPCCVADRPRAPKCTAVLGDSRQQGHRDPG